MSRGFRKYMSVLNVLVASFVFFWTFHFSVSEAEESKLKIYANVGDMAPDFKLNQLQGEPIQLSKLRGKFVLIMFCPPSYAIIDDNIEPTWNAIGKDHLQILVISTDTAGEERTRESAIEHGVTFPILLDPDHIVVRQFATHYPTTFLVDRSGKVIYVMKYSSYWTHERYLDAIKAAIKGK